MQLTSFILSAGLAALALAPTGALAWKKAANGVWVADNTWYGRVGNHNNVHESCTKMNSQTVYTDGRDCTYWTNGNGGQGHGHCSANNNRVDCKRGCPNPFSVCQYAEDDGSCSRGYVACLQKMGCGGRAGEFDCGGTAAGCAAAKCK